MSSSTKHTSSRAVAWTPVVIAIVIFALLAALVSWPWHQGASTRAQVDLEAQQGVPASATVRFCSAMGQLRDASHRAIIATQNGDRKGLTSAIASIDEAFASARRAGTDIPHIKNLAVIRAPRDSASVAAGTDDDPVPETQPITGYLVELSLAAKLESARADCPTFS